MNITNHIQAVFKGKRTCRFGVNFCFMFIQNTYETTFTLIIYKYPRIQWQFQIKIILKTFINGITQFGFFFVTKHIVINV